MSSCTLRAVVTALAVLLALPGLAAARPGPEIRNFSLALPWSWAHPGAEPRGANDPACRPTASHPRPVILLHGTLANQFNSFAELAPALRRQGFCPFSLDYGKGPIRGLNGTRTIRASAAELAAFVAHVRAATGAAQVDLVGYSQGVLVARAFLRDEGGADPADPSRNLVGTVVGLSGLNHGTPALGVPWLLKRYGLGGLVPAVVGPAFADVSRGSAFLEALSGPGETEPGVRYTMIATVTDLFSTPYTDAYLRGGAPGQVRNVLLQDGCPSDLSDHFNLTYSPRAIALTVRALDPASGMHVPCGFLLPGV